MTRLPVLIAVSAALLLLILLGSVGGAEQLQDRTAILQLAEWRAMNPRGTGWVILLTHAGGAPFLLTVAGLGVLALLVRRQRANAVLLALTVLGGRLGVEIIKLAVDRPRPSFDAHPVMVFSQSFPSGHAANSTVTYLALALFVVPERWRRSAAVGAMLLALAIGATRPVLGVHWPSDVLGGWIYGLLVIVVAAWVSRPRQSAA
jgi:undecaprenyl-diphosphatase